MLLEKGTELDSKEKPLSHAAKGGARSSDEAAG